MDIKPIFSEQTRRQMIELFALLGDNELPERPCIFHDHDSDNKPTEITDYSRHIKIKAP